MEPDQKAISEYIKALLKETETAVSATKAQLFEAQQLLNEQLNINGRWQKFISEDASDVDWEQLHSLEHGDGRSNKANLHNWLDTHLRHDLFVLATHYWEGRWLQSVRQDGFDQPGHKESRNEASQRRKWRRYAMLTPCFVNDDAHRAFVY